MSALTIGSFFHFNGSYRFEETKTGVTVYSATDDSCIHEEEGARLELIVIDMMPLPAGLRLVAWYLDETTKTAFTRPDDYVLGVLRTADGQMDYIIDGEFGPERARQSSNFRGVSTAPNVAPRGFKLVDPGVAKEDTDP